LILSHFKTNLSNGINGLYTLACFPAIYTKSQQQESWFPMPSYLVQVSYTSKR